MSERLAITKSPANDKQAKFNFLSSSTMRTSCILSYQQKMFILGRNKFLS